MKKYDWSNKDSFLKDWDKSKNICSFLKDKGLTFTSGNYKTFKKWYNIHTSDVSTNQKKSLGNIFSENSVATRKQINKKIKELNLLNYECAVCSNLGTWNGKPLVLQLEHKNGINNDNRIENLEYLCPNCHSQTNSFAGSNVHNKIFENRIADIVNLKQNIILKVNVITLSKTWNTSYNSALKWLRIYESKLQRNNIELDYTLKAKRVVNRKNDYWTLRNDNQIIQKLMAKWCLSEDRVKRIISKFKTQEDLHISIEDKNEMKKNDIKEVSILENPVGRLSEMWNMETSTVKITIKKLNLDNLHTDFKRKEIKQFNTQQRIKQVSVLTNKKQVPELAKKWNTSVNGAKKWIRNNIPDKYKEIYDDSLLEKNKKLAAKRSKKDEFSNLTSETFDCDILMEKYSTNKSGVYSLLSRYNQELYLKLMPSTVCRCGGKTRTCGTVKNQTQYRCLSCNYTFT